MNDTLENGVQMLANRFFATWPQPQPQRTRLRNCKLVAHRGQHDNQQVLENSLAAFELATSRGVWGFECDVRWTRDLQPVISHDADCQRLFGSTSRIADLTLAELRAEFPLIPSLEDVVHRYGGRHHLMIELKAEPYPNPERQWELLRQLLSGLEPLRDYHMLALEPGMLECVEFVPRLAMILVAMRHPRTVSETTIRDGYGGIAGHYVLLGNTLLTRHRRAGQHVGTGFVSSRNCLYREINRGVEWIFSNHAAELQDICNDA